MFFSDVKFVSSKSIRLNLIKSIYECKYSYTLMSSLTDRGTTSKDFLEKDINVKLLRNQREPNMFNIHTDIKKLTLDSTKIKQEKFKQKLHELTKDLTLAINQKGDVLSIVNHDDILKRWKQIKQSTLDTFKGSVVEKYMQGLEDKINDEQKLIGDIKQYRLLGFLFNGLYGDYTSPTQKQKIHLQAISYFPIAVRETYTWVEKDEKGEICIKVTGLIDEAKTSVKKISTYFQRKGYPEAKLELIKYKGDYKIDPETGWINQANFNMALQYGEDYLKSQTITIKQV